MRICTFNVNSIRARMELLTKWLEKRENDIDILCLQELKAPDDKIPVAELEKFGYSVAFWGQPKYNGVAICSKKEMLSIKRGLGDTTLDQQSRLITCKVGDISVVNAYAPHGDLRGEEKYYYKLKWYQSFLSYLENQFSYQEPLLVVGDLNVTLSDFDVYDADLLRDAIGTMAEERESLQKILNWGLVDTYRYLYPQESSYTWWSYMGGGIWKNEGMRIDYVLATSPLMKDLEGVEVDIWPRRRKKPTPSDHAPVIAEFNLP